MEEQLNLAPCGYLVIDSSNRIIEMNETLRNLIGTEKQLGHIHELLTVASRAYFQTYFAPSLKTYGKVDEMFLTLKGEAGRIPVLMNTAERNGFYECVLVPMTVRQEYENELLLAKRQAEKVNQETAEAYKQLTVVVEEVEGKKQELEKLNRQLQELAVTDPLTGLKNRRYLDEKLLRLLEKSTGKGQSLALLIVDIDHFKKVNDIFGHAAGDAVLQELAWKLQAETTESDIAARLGGEEFVLVLKGAGKQQAWKTAEQIRANVEHGSWKHVKVTVSIGIAVYEEGDDAKSLLAKADEALYLSKKAGRNLVTSSW